MMVDYGVCGELLSRSLLGIVFPGILYILETTYCFCFLYVVYKSHCQRWALVTNALVAYIGSESIAQYHALICLC